jgi:hypothetical protein
MPSDRDAIAIVGGGIAGLFCAYALGSTGHKVTLYESTERLGGRIRTVRLGKKSRLSPEKNLHLPGAGTPGWNENNLEFYAEFGPMRIELEKQPLVKALLGRFGIKKEGQKSDRYARLIDFPAYASPGSSHEPHYDLPPDEAGKSPLELMRLRWRAICDIQVEEVNEFAKLRNGDKGSKDEHEVDASFMRYKKKFEDEIAVAGATQWDWLPIFTRWVAGVTEEHLWQIQTTGFIRRRFHANSNPKRIVLYKLGFWNLLDEYLSYNAILKIRDMGSFYHLLPENPNAAEWLVWWLRGFAISETMQGIYGGMECIVDYLRDVLRQGKCKKNVKIYYERTLSRIGFSSGAFQLDFEKFKPVSRRKVILALPKDPLVQGAQCKQRRVDTGSVRGTGELHRGAARLRVCVSDGQGVPGGETTLVGRGGESRESVGDSGAHS